jgi:predicted dehydrogenase
MNRRNFIKSSAVAGASYWLATSALSAARAADRPNGKVQFAGIGVGGKGSSDVDQCVSLGTIVALCDIDDNTLQGKFKQEFGGERRGRRGQPQPEGNGQKPFSGAQLFHDYREMLDKMGDKIDAVTVSTADHTHAPASIRAMKMGKHVYCQKPLTHTVWEARQMRLLAKQNRVCTQMGNQGTAETGLRRAAEIVQAGVLGPVKEVHVWTNRPIWPQGADAILSIPVVRQAALAALHHKEPGELKYPEPPSHVHWDLFVGSAPERPYTPGIHPFSWRGWLDYGTGALGDMACHTANMAYMALKLGSPLSAEAKDVHELNSETYPTQAHAILQFPSRGDMPAVTWHWYEGQFRGRKMLPPRNLLNKVLKPGQELADSGSILVGDRGILFSPNDYGAAYTLIGDGVEEAAKQVPESLPRNGRGDQGMKEEWVKAIHENKPEIAMSNFDYAGMLTETVLLGNVAIRTGKKIEFDGEKCEVTNAPEANALIKKQYRKGFEI